MGLPVRLSPAAARDLDQARCWLRQPGAGERATKKLQRIRNSIYQIGETPNRWPVGDHPDVREIPVEGYRVLYRIQRDSDGMPRFVFIIRVFGPHMKRDAL